MEAVVFDLDGVLLESEQVWSAAKRKLTLEHGGELAIVTKGETPYDGVAAVKLEGEVDEELEAVLAALT